MSKGLIRTGFHEDLKLGQEVEGHLANILQEGGDTIEVKSDKRASQTGNIYVELTYKGKPSGITKSKAKWWVYEIDGRYFILPLKEMKALAKRAIIEGKVTRGGDFNATEGALVPVEWLVFRERSA